MEDRLIQTLTQILGNGGWMAIGIVLGYLIKKLEKHVEKLEKKIEKIEGLQKDFITKEEHYRDVSGWRGEIRRIEDKIDRLFEGLMEKIMEVVKK